MEIPVIGDYPELPDRNHLTKHLIDISKVGERQYDNHTPDLKPEGFWYSIGSAWLDFWGLEYPDLDGYAFYSITLSDNLFININQQSDINKILRINTFEQLLHFEHLYNVRAYGMIVIDWLEVSKRYGGIEFRYNPFNKPSPRSTWYDTVDLESGCIWRKEILENMNLTLILNNLKEPHAEQIQESYEDEYVSTKKKGTPKRVSIVFKDGKMNESNELTYKMKIDDRIEILTYRFLTDDNVSKFKPRDDVLEYKRLKIRKTDFTDINHPDIHKILRITTNAELLQFRITYIDMINKKKIYDDQDINFLALFSAFGGLEINIEEPATKNTRLYFRTFEYPLELEDGLIWDPRLIYKIKSRK